MLRGIYGAASSMMANMVATDTMANNMANVGTAGFKKSVVNFQSFPEMLIRRMDGQKSVPIGKLPMGSLAQSTTVQFTQGAIRATGNPLDLALDGEGFFTVEDLEGNTSYTRNGIFTIGPTGFIATADGHLVQGERGPIAIPANASIMIDETGSVSINNSPVDRLKITRFTDNTTLQQTGDSLFKATSATEEMVPGATGEAPKYRVHQGQIETSNTNVVSELVESINGNRVYEALQKNIRMQNETLEKTVNQVGRFR